MRCVTPSGFHWMGTDGDCEQCGISQDALDGAALRRLREALPESWASGGYVLIEEGNGDVLVAVGHYMPYEPDERDPVVRADTIAEAADKCREELG